MQCQNDEDCCIYFMTYQLATCKSDPLLPSTKRCVFMSAESYTVAKMLGGWKLKDWDV